MVLQRVQHPGESHLSVAVVVAVAFAVRGDVDQLSVLPPAFESADQALGESFAAVQQPFKGDGA